MPNVSIIVPVFNGSEYIERNSQYILEQEHKNYEVIFVVDSRSSDDTLQKIRDVLPRFGRVMLIEQSEGGLGQARNLGLAQASGDLIWFLDVDDHPLPRYLSTLVAAQQAHDADVVFGNCIMSRHLDPVIRSGRNGVKVMDRHEAMAARGKNRIPVTAWSMIIRADLLEKNNIRFVETGYAEDIDFTYRVLSVADVVCFSEEPLYVYVQSQGSMCSNNNERGLGEIKSYVRLIGHMKENEPWYFRTFHKNAVFTTVRSSTRMDPEKYMEFVRDSGTRDMLNRELAAQVEPELVFFKMFPRMYRIIARTYMKMVFYREGKTF
jgi:CDP-glycerol glycerophosphotransferase